ncbi:MAG TPA: TSCPD domain-containing protein, partial [Brevundimonas sp.]|nr:TSCPD domain-containing protein [Brevundimonas sp.]
MPFRFSDHAATLPCSVREIERCNEAGPVLAPDAWTDVQIESWLDWLETGVGAQPGPDLLHDGFNSYAERLKPCAAGALAATLRLGLASPARPLPVFPDLFDLSDPASSCQLAAETARRKLARRADGALDALSRALARVTDAVSRCDGERGDCADPGLNRALARAATEARRAGACDGDILRAIDGEDFGAEPEPRTPAPLLVVLADRALISSGAPAAMRAAEAGLEGDVILTFEPQQAEAILAAAAAPAVMLSLPALHRIAGPEFDTALADLVSLWVDALAGSGSGLVSIGLGGLADLVLEQTGEDGRVRAAEIADIVRTAGG